jgi:hypothetical protein
MAPPFEAAHNREAPAMRIHAVLLGLIAAATLAACTNPADPPVPTSPVTPGETTITDELLADPNLLVLRGVVGRIDYQGQAFTLKTREATRLVRAGDRTVIWRATGTGRERVRFATLAVGTAVEVRGADRGGFVLAVTIAILR